MEKVHSVEVAEVDESGLYLVVDGQQYHVRLEDASARLLKASPVQRRHVEVSPSGYGLHWPELDEDLSITPLLEQATVLSGTVR